MIGVIPDEQWEAASAPSPTITGGDCTHADHKTHMSIVSIGTEVIAAARCTACGAILATASDGSHH